MVGRPTFVETSVGKGVVVGRVDELEELEEDVVEEDVEDDVEVDELLPVLGI